MNYFNLNSGDLIANIAGGPQAQALMERYTTLSALARADDSELMQVRGIGQATAAAVRSAFALAHRLSQEIVPESPLLDSPEKIADLLREQIRLETTETLHVVHLNTRRRLISSELIANGTLDTILVHPREVFRRAILLNAAACVLVHGHKSGDAAPSEADIKVTRDLIRAGQLMKIEVLDHVILGTRTSERPTDFVSLRELGYFYS